MSARCPACRGTGLLTGGVTCTCITGEMRRIEAAKSYARGSVPPLATGAQTSVGAIRSRALLRRRAAIASVMLAKGKR